MIGEINITLGALATLADDCNPGYMQEDATNEHPCPMYRYCRCAYWDCARGAEYSANQHDVSTDGKWTPLTDPKCACWN